ncbi:MAG TPA: PP2C family protein-serine/threonine phosphatase [Thermomicrobiales bacterium]|nr:PP2C family protein-serine/threonine phosphatase [Thermomicrobiales bacterium]
MPTALTIDVGFAKTEKYASRESGDTVELVERPGGGFSIVMIDGQGSGKAAKTLSLLLSSKAVGLIKEGVRDGVVARATHDHLFAFRHGRVSATFDLLSVDMQTKSIVVSRNAESPMLICDDGGHRVVPVDSGPMGRYQWTKPTVVELPMKAGMSVALFTDGIPHSGRRAMLPPIDFDALAEATMRGGGPASDVAEAILQKAIERDQGRPGDDMAVIALSIVEQEPDMLIRRMSAQFPMA